VVDEIIPTPEPEKPLPPKSTFSNLEFPEFETAQPDISGTAIDQPKEITFRPSEELERKDYLPEDLKKGLSVKYPELYQLDEATNKLNVNIPKLTYLQKKWRQGKSVMTRGTYGDAAMRGEITTKDAQDKSSKIRMKVASVAYQPASGFGHVVDAAAPLSSDFINTQDELLVSP